MPAISWDFGQEENVARLIVKSSDRAFSTVTLWAAESDSLDFRPSKYIRAATVDADLEPSGDKSTNQLEYRLPPDKNVAIFGELRYTINGHEFSLSTPTHVYRRGS